VCARPEYAKQESTTCHKLHMINASHTFDKGCNHMTNAFILVYMVYIKCQTKNWWHATVHCQQSAHAEDVPFHKAILTHRMCQAGCATRVVHHLEQELDKAQLICGDNHASSVAHGRHWQLQLCLFIPLCMHNPLPCDKSL